MSVVIANLCWMVPGDVGGSEEYTTRLLRALAASHHTDPKVKLAGMRGLRTAHPELASDFDMVTAPISGGRRAFRLTMESSWLALATRDVDLIHHFGGHIPAVRGGPAAVTIHDTQPLDLPQNFSATKRAYMSAMLPRTARRARVVCTPSQWVADRVVELLGVDERNVRVVPSTWDDRTVADTGASAAQTRLIRDLADMQVVVYPAVTHPHKNHAVLIEAVARLSPSHPDLRLVLAGARGRGDSEVDSAVSASGLDEIVIRPGRVSAPTVVALIDRADVLAFPSRYEGFGLPLLEAMRCGTPVVSSDSTALPEVLGGSGLLVDPDDSDGWAQAIEAVVGGGPQVDYMVASGRRRSESFSPPRSAGRLLDAWNHAIG